ncbi:Histidinol-phosphate aminotransferase [Candidatus Nasuia deltocephalinicola]|nr:Histidinol-phosphate aminotransferase [Candidatus Nasuia deltocephalinicola]
MIKYNKNYKKLKSYEFGKQPNNLNILKLNANENPYKPSLELIKNLLKEIKFFGNIMKYYPDPDSINIKRIISKYYNIKHNEIFLGNGSDEVLAHTFLLFFKNKKKLYIQDITYSFYESYIKLYKIKYFILKLSKNFTIKEKYLKNIIGNILITNPNAPTGKLINSIKLEKIILNNKKSIILIDEAYNDFNKEKSTINFIKKYNNLLICKTLSKSRSLAGLRLGFIIGDKKNITNLNKIKNSFNTYPINILTQKILISLYKNNKEFIKKLNIINKNKKFLIKNLKKMKFEITNSKSNFLFLKNKNINSNIIIKKMKKNNIFIRKFEIPKIENFLRITIGNKTNCKKILKIIKKIIKK